MSALRWALVVAFAGVTACALGAPDHYTIDPNHTYPSLEFSHRGLSIWRGKFNRTSGTVTLDRPAQAGTAEIQVDTSSIDFGHEKMNAIAQTADWFNVEKFPAMTYKGTLKFQNDAPSSVEGELTLLGVTRPLQLKINSFKCMEHPVFKREVCGADAEGDLNRADFGMGQYTDGNVEKIHLRIQVEAIKD